MTYKFQSLLVKKDDGSTEGKITGAMSPVMFLNIIQDEFGFFANGFCRVWFDNPEYNNWYEEPGKRCLTGCDTVIITQKCGDDIQFMMFVDEGHEGRPVAMMMKSDLEVIITPVYQKKAYEKKLNAGQIKEIFLAAEAGDWLSPKPYKAGATL